MKRLILLLAALGALPLHAGYSYARTITIDHTKVPNTDQTDFPVLVSGTYTYLKTVGNGGTVTDAEGDDIVFATSTTCSSLYKFDRELYIATTGEVVFHVKIPTVATASDTVFYMCYANAAVTTFQGDTNATWNSAFKAVWHFPDGTTLTYLDSTVSARNGTMVGTLAAAAGVIDGSGNSASGSGDDYMTASDTGLPSGTGDRTITFWYRNPNGAAWPGGGYSWVLGNFATANQCMGLRVNPANDGKLHLYDGVDNQFTFAFAVQTWYHIAITWTSSGGQAFVNGVSKGTWTNASQNTTLTGTFWVWESNPAVFNSNSRAQNDEFRISNVVRSADWLVTEYNSGSSPSTFYAVGNEISLAARVQHRVVRSQ